MSDRGIVSYERVSDSYLKQRQLKGRAGWFLLWGLGVGAVISGDFYGWNFGLAKGGFWGLTIATLLMGIMYICMVFSIAELSAALPHAGGFYSFTRSAFGPVVGFICGVALAIEYILTPATIVVGLTGYVQPLIPTMPVWGLWILAYAIFVAINIWNVDLTFYVGLFLTIIAVMVLLIFYISMTVSGVFNLEQLFNISAAPGQLATWLPKGWTGVFAAIPYAIWFYLGIEEVPLAAEETRKVKSDIPLALIFGIFTLVVLSFLTLIINSGVGGGAAAIGGSNIPLADGFDSYFGKGTSSALVTAMALTCGMIASFHTIIYAYGRILFSLSRAGYLPRWISLTNKNHTPYVAIILGALVGLVCAEIINISGSGGAGKILLNMSVFGAVISYLLVMLSYIKLKLDRPDLLSAYESPLGIKGAIVGMILAVVALFACFVDPDYRFGVWGVSIFMLAAIAFFWIFTRHRLVARAPEEKAALLSKRELRTMEE
ncbi:MAG: ethanolamine permease [Cyanosarcina radialis HA8281-LM2]|jgi:ethanolamine permease|nr:ethanolamine permease [Cyanosarcina radialis HA8281-LM2]